MIDNTEAIDLIRQATMVKTGFEQVMLCQQAATLLALPKNATNGASAGPSLATDGFNQNGPKTYDSFFEAINGRSTTNDGAGPSAVGEASSSNM